MVAADVSLLQGETHSSENCGPTCSARSSPSTMVERWAVGTSCGASKLLLGAIQLLLAEDLVL